MIATSTFDFLKGIASHNEKEWFDLHRDAYEAAKADLADLAGALIGRADEFDEKAGKANPDPARCISRINRDMRFAKGKPPYKTDFFVSLGVGELQSTASYYVHVEPGGCYAGGGIFVTQPEALGKIRDRIVAATDKWDGIVEASEMRKLFPKGLTSPETLKNAPRGYDADHPAIEYLRMKGFCANHPLTNKAMQDKDAVDEIVRAFKAARPLVDFINDAVTR